MVEALISNKSTLPHNMLAIHYLHPEIFTLAMRVRGGVAPQHGKQTQSSYRSSGRLAKLTHRGIFRWRSTQQAGLTSFYCCIHLNCCIDQEDRKFVKVVADRT
ncbi:hypothetical protein NDU88_000414 [Pleurodeles waltl]|uniref:Uncharacterized protein n=1 Tax=Pleurodeles waltl TaxID=8319 RepID=A0AAV7UQF4_PLEWA|nr:hypothetical protein NDU88_000414 [Pleurodeles waltl]